ncbi:hypothetical protein GS501_04465 [Saccharibacter sp. 17.LH.SD]|uniref:hypothetical protein n=1 Tax=Saccharibacter sp. 17.LH.SD TaxID=2689393 RepID=UPI001369BDF6|nr:hypothetical protein [Saccharibacter sp. 17.LH.SD]MXV44299.1 hypothetical protein [Saccharibacter sp. 17.LH.SD]
MFSLFTKLRQWMQQPTTLTGFSLLVAGIAGAFTGALSQEMSTTLVLAALPSLLPDNSTSQKIGQTVAPMIISELERRHQETAASNKPPHSNA